jgi:transposase-like protein
MTIRPELLDELLKDYAKPEDLVGENGLLKQLTKALVERCLDTEMDLHLADPKYKTEGKAKRDRRNGHSQKTIKGELGSTAIDIPRDPLANIFRRETLLQIWLPTVSSSRRWSRRDKLALTALIARFCPCMGVA